MEAYSLSISLQPSPLGWIERALAFGPEVRQSEAVEGPR
jgi:hypothetical protein